jgi:hypothetical protein
MFEGALPFLVRRLRDHFWLDGYEMLARASIESRRLDRLNYSQLGSASMRNRSTLTCLPAYLLAARSSKPRNFAVSQLSGGHISSCELRVPAELGESGRVGLEIKARHAGCRAVS